MKDYYLYLDPDDGILYVQKDGEVIAPVRTSASFDPKTIRIEDGYLQVKDFVSDAWIYICDKDGNAVSLKGPSGETANLDLSRDVESVLIDSNNEVDGDHILYTTVRYFLGSKQIKITNENLKVALPDGWECVYHNQLYYYDSGNPDYSVKYTFKVPAKTKFNNSSEQIKIETVGIPFASKTFTVYSNLSDNIWNIECTPSWFQVDVKDGITYPTNVSKIDIVPINKKHQAFPSDYTITATQNGIDLPVYENENLYYIDIPEDHFNDINVCLKNSDGYPLDIAVIEFMFDSKSAHEINADSIKQLTETVVNHETSIEQMQVDLAKKQDSNNEALNTPYKNIVQAINYIYSERIQTIAADSTSDLLTKGLNPGMYIIQLPATVDVQPELPDLPDNPSIERQMSAPTQFRRFGLLLVSKSMSNQSMILVLDDGVYINKNNTEDWMEVKWDNIASASLVDELETRLVALETQLAEQQSSLNTIDLEGVASVWSAKQTTEQ